MDQRENNVHVSCTFPSHVTTFQLELVLEPTNLGDILRESKAKADGFYRDDYSIVMLNDILLTSGSMLTENTRVHAGDRVHVVNLHGK